MIKTKGEDRICSKLTIQTLDVIDVILVPLLLALIIFYNLSHANEKSSAIREDPFSTYPNFRKANTFYPLKPTSLYVSGEKLCQVLRKFSACITWMTSQFLHFFKTYVYLFHNPSSSSFEKKTFCTCCCHCVKSVEIKSYLWSLFFCIQSEYRKYGPKITLYLDTVCTQAVCVQKNFWTLSDEKIQSNQLK